ncbi:unnamed protein product [Penicillium camemberti]|uniref:Str. FM013 n=1 Tax=Penicillium camemberti (strain FM 013) TaxID=1429867 RepID=A0A0G4P0B7_PENC3|nr:unnamed protein product [Penicillium camemberti]
MVFASLAAVLAGPAISFTIMASSSPFLSWLFETEMELGVTLVGLPYFRLAGLFVLYLVGLILILLWRREQRILYERSEAGVELKWNSRKGQRQGPYQSGTYQWMR